MNLVIWTPAAGGSPQSATGSVMTIIRAVLREKRGKGKLFTHAFLRS